MKLLVSFLREVEGVSFTSYPDSGGKRTIGVGHLIKPWEHFKEPLTMAQVEDLLLEDSREAVAAVDRMVTIPLNEHERAAVASWVFNLGEGVVNPSNTLTALNSGDKAKFLRYLAMWNKVTVNGKKVVSRGLSNRRAKEALLFKGEWHGGAEKAKAGGST